VHGGTSPDHEIRYTSGKTIYVEGLVDSRWVGRYWTPSGRINFPYQRFADDAFELQVKDNPDPAAPPISLSKGWGWVAGTESAAGKLEGVPLSPSSGPGRRATSRGRH